MSLVNTDMRISEVVLDPNLAAAIDNVVAQHNFGQPSAAKRGRNPRWPYVPIIDHGEVKIGVHRTRTEQIQGKAFARREEAVAYAARIIDARRIKLRTDLADPGHRAHRAQYGLPIEIRA